MTTATIWKNNFVNRICIKGHSGYSVNGSDIVCSSISTACFLTANILTKLTKSCCIKIDDKNVYIDIQIIDVNVSKEVKIVMETLQETLEDISSQYPKFLTILYC